MDSNRHHGIEAMGIALPRLSLELAELATLRSVPREKYAIGLGCREMALCDVDEDAVTLGVRAARRALSRWGGRPDQLGMFVVGTETAKDMSRPLSAFLADELGLSGSMRSFEAKHACYGGTVGVRSALEWRASGAARGRRALVVATDVALYAEEDPGEPTQGAGAVAMIVGEPEIAAIDLVSYAHAEPAFDFYRPVGEAHPRVDGKLSLDCYVRAAERCFAGLEHDHGTQAIERMTSVVFHSPFPRMARKAVARLGTVRGWDETRTEAWYARCVAPTLAWSERVGNTYTASVWLNLACALAEARAGDRLAAFSYGSGFGSELSLFTAGPLAHRSLREDVENDLAERKKLDAAGYVRLREARSR